TRSDARIANPAPAPTLPAELAGSAITAGPRAVPPSPSHAPPRDPIASKPAARHEPIAVPKRSNKPPTRQRTQIEGCFGGQLRHFENVARSAAGFEFEESHDTHSQDYR